VIVLVTIFWFSVFGAVYSYFIYPSVLIALLPFRRNRSRVVVEESPTVSLIIAARNEAAGMARKLENTVALAYPKEKLEILVVSDASEDATDDIARAFEARGVRLIRSVDRKGKEYAQKLGIQNSSGEILVFSDAATFLDTDGLAAIVSEFDDPLVGAVSSEDRVMGRDGAPKGEGAYVSYEMWLRSIESRVNSIVGVSGSFFAIRRSLTDTWDTTVPSDFNAALSCVRHGYVAVSSKKSLGYYAEISHESKEFERKYRTVIRGIHSLVANKEVLNPAKYGFFAYQIFSHKVMRWLVPWFMIVAFATNGLIAHLDGIYLVLFSIQIGFYSIAIGGGLSERARRNWLVRWLYFFLISNIAIAKATGGYLAGTRVTQWEPSKR